jgi:DNA-directed RNA polymerase subunit RPC12/RpoP
MINCPSCGAEGPDESKFCVSCGKTIPAKTNVAKPRCSSCNSEVTEGSKFCVNCGAPLTKINVEWTPACTQCGAETPKDSKFCTNCGATLEASANEPFSGVASGGALERYFSSLEGKMVNAGFETFEKPAIINLDRAFRRKKFELAKVGSVTTFCGVKYVSGTIQGNIVETFSKNLFDYALRNKGFFARNAFQSVLVYPVIITAGAPADVQNFLDSYWPKHWMAFEFPVIVDISIKKILCHSSTPLWGWAFHEGFKKDAEMLFGAQ